MSAVANTTPIVTTVTKTANKEKTQKEMDKVNIQNFYEEHYDDILPIIMDKVHCDKRKEVHTRLDFAERSKNKRGFSKFKCWRFTHEIPHLFKRPRGSFPALEVAPPIETAPDRDRLRDTEESYDGIYSSQGIRTKYRGPPRDRRRSRSTRRWRESESPPSRGSESSTSDTGHWKSRNKRRKTLEEDLAVPWSCEDVDLFTPRFRNFRSPRKTRMPNNVKTYDELEIWKTT
ncbi:hypothetical protein Tco_1483758 [Tanacetum coccineum]